MTVFAISAVDGCVEQPEQHDHPSESQNRLLANDYHSEEDHKETEVLKSGMCHITMCGSLQQKKHYS